jgi:hypothetical protein
MKETDAVIQQVKQNCNISDAKFWGYYSICGLLMRYRELYRSEHSLMPWDSIDNGEVCRWIQERERLWLDLEDAELQRIIIDGVSYDPFDITGLNAILRAKGLVYGGGYGTFNKPTFFIAELEASRDLFDYRVHYTGNELCRDLAASPAMLQGSCIYVRPEVLSIFIWDRFQELRANRFSGLTEKMFSGYGIQSADEPCPELYRKIRDMAGDASEVFVLHEAGEAYEDEYSDLWHEILCEGCDKATELFLRGIKDVRADTSAMGPLRMIVESGDRAGISFFVAFLDGIRKEIFPEIIDAFRQFVESGDWTLLENARRTGYQRAERLQTEIAGLWKKQREMAAIAGYIRDTLRKKPG